MHFKYLLLILNSPWKTKWFPQMKDILKMTAFHTDNVVLLAVCQYQTISTFFFYLAVKDTCSRLALLCCQRIEFLSCFMSCHWSNCSFQGKLQDSSSVFGLFFSDSTLLLNLVALVLMFRVSDEIFLRCSSLHTPFSPKGFLLFFYNTRKTLYFDLMYIVLHAKRNGS